MNVSNDAEIEYHHIPYGKTYTFDKRLVSEDPNIRRIVKKRHCSIAKALGFFIREMFYGCKA